MSLTRRIFFGAAASWFSRGLTIVLGLVLLPVLFRHLPQEELGVWLLLGQSWATLGILDLGFGVTLTREIAFAKGKSGSDPGVPLTDITLSEIADIMATGTRVYRVLAILSLIIAFVLGAVYLDSLTLNEVAVGRVWLAWSILCFSFAINTWATPWTSLLQGVGYVGWDALLLSFVNALTLVGQIVVALLGGGLVGLAAVAVFGALAQRTVFFAFARYKRPELFRLTGTWCGARFKKMLPLSIRAWLTALGLTLVLNTDHLFVARLQGPSILPDYRAAYLIFLNINMLAATVAGASSVFISHLWQAGNLGEVQRIVIRNSRLGLFVMAATGGCILGLGKVFFDFWLGSGHFVGLPVIIAFFVLLLFEAQTFIITTASRATEDEAFVLWAVGAGVLKVTFSWFLGKWFGLLGIALSALLAQLLTNHWYMVYRGLHRLQIGLKSYLVRVFMPVLAILGATFGLSFATVQFSGRLSGWSLVLVSAVLAGSVLCAALWQGVLEQDHRRRITRRFFSFS